MKLDILDVALPPVDGIKDGVAAMPFSVWECRGQHPRDASMRPSKIKPRTVMWNGSCQPQTFQYHVCVPQRPSKIWLCAHWNDMDMAGNSQQRKAQICQFLLFIKLVELVPHCFQVFLTNRSMVRILVVFQKQAISCSNFQKLFAPHLGSEGPRTQQRQLTTRRLHCAVQYRWVYFGGHRHGREAFKVERLLPFARA